MSPAGGDPIEITQADIDTAREYMGLDRMAMLEKLATAEELVKTIVPEAPKESIQEPPKLGTRERELVRELNLLEHDNQLRWRSGREPAEKNLRRQHKIKVLLGSIKTLGAIEFH